MLDKLKKKLEERKADVIDIVKLPEGERDKRLDICKQCDNLGKMDFCKICHCYMPVKTYIPNQSCPIKKW